MIAGALAVTFPCLHQVYVVFYDNADGSRSALVFAKQITSHGMGESFGRDHYLNIVHF